MSYFFNDAQDEARDLIEQLVRELKGEDHIVFHSGLSQDFHDVLEELLADKIYQLRLAYPAD